MREDYWFKHDANARHDPKIRKLRRDKGAVAKAVYWDLIEMLRCSGGKMKIGEAIDEVCDENRLDDGDIPLYVIQDSGLFECENGEFWSNRLLAEIQYAKERAERNKNNGQRGGRPRKETQNKPTQNPVETHEKPSGLFLANPEKTTDNSIQVTDNSNNIDSSLHSESLSTSEDLFPREKVMTPEEMVAIWNEGCGELPKARQLTDKRKQCAKVRIKEFGKTKEEQVAIMKEITSRLAQSDFANGRTGGTWRPDFGWIIRSPENWVKVLEGRYDNRSNNKPSFDNKNVNDLWKD